MINDELKQHTLSTLSEQFCVELLTPDFSCKPNIKGNV